MWFCQNSYPNGSIIEAKYSSTGSYPWRSILHGRDVLLRGCRWRVGNGRSVHIWQSTWLPRKHPTKVTSPIIDSMVDAKVEILIDEATHRWNHSVIDGIFIPEEAELIKSILLPQQGVDDRVFWPFTQTGTYTQASRVFHCSSTVPFWLATLSLFFFSFKFWTVATGPSDTVAIVDTFFFFFNLLFVLFFPFYIYHCTSSIFALWAHCSYNNALVSWVFFFFSLFIQPFCLFNFFFF